MSPNGGCRLPSLVSPNGGCRLVWGSNKLPHRRSTCTCLHVALSDSLGRQNRLAMFHFASEGRCRRATQVFTMFRLQNEAKCMCFLWFSENQKTLITKQQFLRWIFTLLQFFIRKQQFFTRIRASDIQKHLVKHKNQGKCATVLHFGT